jgi:hypothetical protein
VIYLHPSFLARLAVTNAPFPRVPTSDGRTAVLVCKAFEER